MYKLGLEKAEEPEAKLPTFLESWRKQNNSRKTSISASLTMPKPLTVWITRNENSERDGNTRPLDLPLEESVCRSGGLVFPSLSEFSSFFVIHTVKGFGIVNEAEIDIFLELSCFFHDPADVGHLISGSSAFSKTSLNIRKFMVHVLLKPGLENFEHYFTSM